MWRRVGGLFRLLTAGAECSVSAAEIEQIMKEKYFGAPRSSTTLFSSGRSDKTKRAQNNRKGGKREESKLEVAGPAIVIACHGGWNPNSGVGITSPISLCAEPRSYLLYGGCGQQRTAMDSQQATWSQGGGIGLDGLMVEGGP